MFEHTITDTLGTGLLSFVGRLSLSRRLALSNLAPRPCYVYLASSPGFTVWVHLLPLHAAQTTLLAFFWYSKSSPSLLERETQHGNGDRVYRYASHRGSVRSRRLFMYSCNHSVGSQCPLSGVERLYLSWRLDRYVLTSSVLSDLAVQRRLSASRIFGKVR